MNDRYNLQRFVDAQGGVFRTAIAELRAGRKQSHWMWFVFPQLAGLGRSPTAQFYGIRSADEARAYLDHPLLGSRLRQSVEALKPWAGKRSPEDILGAIDALKLRSSMTLFQLAADGPGSVFERVLDRYFGGRLDEATLERT